MDFTKHKFLDLPFERQHKKCAECLRSIYKALLAGQKVDDLSASYNEAQSWLGSPPLENIDPKIISNRYHEHLRKAKVRHKEHNLLPRVKQGDNLKAKSDPWPIVVYLDNLRSAHNVGSIVRTVEALALGFIYFSAGTPYIDKNRQDAAMGASDWVACIADASLDNTSEAAYRDGNLRDAISLYEFPYSLNLLHLQLAMKNMATRIMS